jgi:translation initiation factor IF-2
VPVRIYALAKDLNLDSKELVEVCRKAGIPGKGSALASLTDQEAEKVKNFLAADKKKPEAAARPGAPSRPGVPDTYTRDDYIAPGHTGRIRVLDVGRKPAEKPKDVAGTKEPQEVRVTEEPERPKEIIEPAESPEIKEPEQPQVAAAAQQPPEPVEPQPPDISAESPEPQLPREAAPPKSPRETRDLREIREPREVREIKDLREMREPKEPEPAESPADRTPKRREPVIKLAEAPQLKQPPAKPKPPAPKAQKPDIRLPKDVITGHKAGQRGPLEHLTKSLEEGAPKKAAEKKAKKAPPAPSTPKKPAGEAPGTPAEAPLSGKGAHKRRRPETTGEERTTERGLAGMASARADRQKARKTKTRGRTGTGRDEDDRETATTARRPRTLTRRRNVNTAAPRKEKVVLDLPCTVRSFSEASGVSAGAVLRTLMTLGISALNINAELERETAELIATELGVDVEFREASTLEHDLVERLDAIEDAPESLKPRPPIVTFLGHVDHGKTSLLDTIIGINVVSGEAGGITQHIRAYQISRDTRKISFVDTPGHEAFTEMRARGANVTDIAVLVVAAEDGVMPQTEEAISHARAAGVPIVVALNKIDLPGADPNRVMQQLAAQNLLPSEWGGDIEVIRTSALTGEGVSDLLETILLTAEMNEYKANPDRHAVGVCLEAEQEPGRGVIAKLIVRNGTLHVGDIVVCGESYGRVKAMYDTLRPGQRVKKAGPSTPVNVTGLDVAPGAGDRFHVLEDISQAREIAEQRANRHRQQTLSGVTTRVSFEEFQRRLAEGKLVEVKDTVHLNLIIRADVRGSIEAIDKELSKLQHPEVQIKILHRSVGAITAADVMLAHASQAVIIGFNVIPDEAARSLADEKQVEIRRYDIIYKMTDDIRALLEGKLKPEERKVELGHALVKRVFSISRIGAIAGCYVVRGSLLRGCRVRVNRDGRTIGDYEVESLRREKDDVKEVPRGMECGVKLAGFNDVKQDDVLEAYRIEEVARSL